MQNEKSENFVVRTMSRNELEFAVNWAEREGWNPGLHDAQCFYAADPGGFFIGLLDDLPVACVSAVRYGADFGFMGFYIVEPEYRHRGYGMEVARVGMQYLAGRTIGLDGVVEQQDNYRKSGFDWAYRNVRYRGSRRGPAEPGCAITPLSEIPFVTLCDYDRTVFPAERSTFLRAWICQAGSRALGVVDGNELQGYGVIRQCCDGYKIGPLFADSAALAESLFQALSASVPEGQNIYLDIPEINEAARTLVRRHGMEVVFETARMYHGQAPRLPIEKIFGVTTFELG